MCKNVLSVLVFINSFHDRNMAQLNSFASYKSAGLAECLAGDQDDMLAVTF